MSLVVSTYMLSLNHTSVSHTAFCLLGNPGLDEQHMWISNPFFIFSVITLLGNSLLIFIIFMEWHLHDPIYLFLCMLSGADIVLSTCTVPQALAIFWLNAREISLDRCITQLFFIHSTFISESGILLVMAFGCYIAMLPAEIHHYSYTYTDRENRCDYLFEKLWYNVPNNISSEKANFL